MIPIKSRSSADVKIKLNKVLQRATNEILSKLDNIENIKSFGKQFSCNEINSVGGNCHHLQKSSSLPEWDNSGRTKLKGKVEDDLTSGSNCRKKYFGNESLDNILKGNKNFVVKPVGKRGFNDRQPLSKENHTGEHIDDQSSCEVLKSEYQKQTLETPRPTYSGGTCKSYMKNNNSQLFARGLPYTNCSELNLANVKVNLPAEESFPGIWHKGKKDFVPPKTGAVGKTRTDIPVYVGRVCYKENIIPAPVVPGKGLAYFSWGGQVFSTNQFEILEIHKFAWKDEGSALESPVPAFPVGQTAKGNPLYLGRVYIEGMGPWVGRVHDDEQHIYIAFRGNELRIPQPYEVFVTY